MFKKVIALLLASLMVFTLAGCAMANATTTAAGTTAAGTTVAGSTTAKSTTAAAATGKTFRIGFYTPLTGVNAGQGISAQNSVKLYVKELNARGGLLGMPVEVVYYDDQSKTEEAVKIATKIVESDNVDVCMASLISNCVLASGKILNDAKIPTFGEGLSPTWMKQGWKYVFRPTLNSANSIPSLVPVMQSFGYKTVAVFEGQDDYGVNAGKTMRAAAQAAGLTVTTTENYVSGDTDFSGQVAKILATKPDSVFLGVLSGEVGNAIKQFRQFGYQGAVFYSENVQQDMMEIGGAAMNHVIFAHPYVLYSDIKDSTKPIVTEYLTKYKAEFGEFPRGDCGYRAWDTMMVIETAVTKANSTDGDAIRSAILSISDLKVTGGTLNFAKTGDGEGLFDFSKYVILNGKNVLLDDWIKSDDYKTFMEKFGKK